jgi:type I restriction enzyme, S subunit
MINKYDSVTVGKLIPEGFFKTEIGVFPNDWVIDNIGNICKIFGRIGFRGYTIKDIVQKNLGAISLSPSNIVEGRLDISNCTYISWFKYEESPEIKISEGDVLLVKTGSTFGKTAIVRNLKEKATLNPQVVVLKKIKIDNFFLAYMMGFTTVQNQINSFIVGGAIPTLSQKQVAKFQIPLPPTKAEQTAIATALSDMDALIEGLEKLIEKKRKIKQGAMQELLKPKEGWEERKLGDLTEITMGQSPLSVYYNKEMKGLPLIQGNADIKNRKTIIRSYTSHITKRGNKGDTIISVRAPVGEISKATFNCCLGRGVCAFSYNNEYLYYYLIFIENTWNKYSTGSTFDSVNSKQLNELFIFLPKSKEEQIKTASILFDLDNEIEQLEIKHSKYKNMKVGMMQELLTGKRRLIDDGKI